MIFVCQGNGAAIAHLAVLYHCSMLVLDTDLLETNRTHLLATQPVARSRYRPEAALAKAESTAD